MPSLAFDRMFRRVPKLLFGIPLFELVFLSLRSSCDATTAVSSPFVPMSPYLLFICVSVCLSLSLSLSCLRVHPPNLHHTLVL